MQSILFFTIQFYWLREHYLFEMSRRAQVLGQEFRKSVYFRCKVGCWFFMWFIYCVKKNIYKIRFFCSGIFARYPQPVGDFENPSGNPPGPRARRVALGIFKIPSGLRGIWAKIPSKKPEFPLQFPKNLCFRAKKMNLLFFFPEISIIITGYLKRRSHSPWVYILWNICTGSFRGKTLNSWIITLNVL